MKKIATLIIAVSLLSIVILLIIKTDDVITTEVFKVDDGFGYMLSYKQNVLIKQNIIPAIHEQKPFYSSNEALLVANFVKMKLENNQTPAISKEDLKKLNIHTNCLEHNR